MIPQVRNLVELLLLVTPNLKHIYCFLTKFYDTIFEFTVVNK